MRRLRGISSSWVVTGMAKSGRVCVGGEVADISLRAMGGEWRPGAGPRQKLVWKGTGFAALSKGLWPAVSLQG